MTSNTQSRVLVTGASGFIAMHCILQLLEQGYQVRGTVRSTAKADRLRQILQQHSQQMNRLEFGEADLMEDGGWTKAASGCDYILHVASPVLLEEPKNEDELILPAREGTLRVLRAAHQAGVRRVVLTSSTSAITDGHDNQNKIFDESDWSNLNGQLPAYPKSKTLAEKAAWEFANQPEISLELAVINPSYVLGPVLDAQKPSPSAELILTQLRREYPGVPRLNFPVVDVRDVAAAHLAAMTIPEAAGKRYICSTDNMWVEEMAQILQAHFGPQGYKITTRRLPDFVLRLVALFDAKAALVANDLGVVTRLSTRQIREVLDWQPRSPEEAVISMAQSLIDLQAV